VVSIQELRLKVIREEGKQEKSEEILQLEETLQTLKEQNEKERLALVELEGVLSRSDLGSFGINRVHWY
jgi:hypothetical protein